LNWGSGRRPGGFVSLVQQPQAARRRVKTEASSAVIIRVMDLREAMFWELRRAF